MGRGMVFTTFSPGKLWAGPALLAVLGWSLACHGAGSPRASAGARLWIEGPVRWLVLPEELKAFRSLESAGEVVEFIEAFWRRRDPTPGEEDNPFRQAFQEREQAADQLYGEAGRRGSLTDRGRALILLGAPSLLRYRQVPVPVLDPGGRRGPERRKRWMTQEVWVYAPRDLPPALLELLPAGEEDGEIALIFVAEKSRAYMVEGEKICELAAQAAVRADPPS